MAFTPKTWQERIVQYPERIILTPTGNTNEYDKSRSEGNITQAGDILSAENFSDLETRIAEEFEVTPEISSGTWTPAYYAGTTPVNVTTTQASYVKIGKMVLITLATAGSDLISDSGAITIDGLPIVPVIDGTAAAYVNTSNKPIFVRAEGTKLYFNLYGTLPATKNDMADFSYIRLSIIYEAE